ncbi:MAG: 50S ribosomal protein L21 [Fibrobacterota bacterium]
MYSIIDLGGHQYKVSAGTTLNVDTVDAKPEQVVTFDRVLLFADNEAVIVGRPLVSGAVVKARVLVHGLSDKITVFKKHRRKDYRKKVGHRQAFTRLLITEIICNDKKEVYQPKPKKAPAEKPVAAAPVAVAVKPAKKASKTEKKG